MKARHSEPLSQLSSHHHCRRSCTRWTDPRSHRAGLFNSAHSRRQVGGGPEARPVPARSPFAHFCGARSGMLANGTSGRSGMYQDDREGTTTTQPIHGPASVVPGLNGRETRQFSELAGR